MSRFAVIKNNCIVNIIVAESKEIADAATNSNCVAVSNEPGGPEIGWTWDETNFSPPEPTE
jgi:hypothetical protein